MIATIVGIGLIRGVKMYQNNMINAKTGGKIMVLDIMV